MLLFGFFLVEFHIYETLITLSCFRDAEAMQLGEGTSTEGAITYREVQEERGEKISRRLEDSEGYRYGLGVRDLTVAYHFTSSGLCVSTIDWSMVHVGIGYPTLVPNNRSVMYY